MTENVQSVSNISLSNIIAEHELRKKGWLEATIGPEWYRLVNGIFTNPLSVIGLIITAIFVLIAIFAPQIAPPVGDNYDPYLIPRDGYGAEPEPPGTVWEREVPPVPGWLKLFSKTDQWTHILGTTRMCDH